MTRIRPERKYTWAFPDRIENSVRSRFALVNVAISCGEPSKEGVHVTHHDYVVPRSINFSRAQKIK